MIFWDHGRWGFSIDVGDMGVRAEIDESFCYSDEAAFEGEVEWGIAAVVLNVGVEVQECDQEVDH